MSKKVLDLETTTTHDTIWMGGVYEPDTDTYTQFTNVEELTPLIQDGDEIIMHNGIDFDYPVASRVWGYQWPDVKVVDTLVMSRLLSPTAKGGHSLKLWGERLGNNKGDFTDYNEPGATVFSHRKPDRLEWYEDEDGEERYIVHPAEDIYRLETRAEWWDRMGVYCEQDCRLTWELYEHLLRKLRVGQFTKRSFDLEHAVQWVISDQIRNGIHFDVEAAQELYTELQAKAAVLLTSLQDEFPPIVTQRWSDKTGNRLKDSVEVFNPGAPSQIARRLMSRGVKLTELTEGGSIKMNDDILDSITHPAAAPIQEYKTLEKRISQMNGWFKHYVEETQRIYGYVNTMGAGTYRMSHSNPNLAQVPAAGKPYGVECRRLFCVPEGKVMLGADASGLELRCFASATGDADYAEVVVNGDVHQYHADLLGVDRRTAKTFIYAFLYGAGNGKLGSIIGGSGAAARALFLDKVPGLLALKERIEAQHNQGGYVLGLDGRRVKTVSEHSALNYRLQSDGALVMKQALVVLHQWIAAEEWECRPMQVVSAHDEWQFEVLPNEADRLGILAVKAIKQAGIDFNMTCPLDGEYMTGKSWAETH